MNLTDQQKLEILCAYLPNGVEIEGNEGTIIEFTKINHSVPLLTCNSDIRPILRHPDDMTEEELLEMGRILIGYDWGRKDIAIIEAKKFINEERIGSMLSLSKFNSIIRYLHSLHIDTFGAIEAGWAVRKETN